jgi:hypothetical protein
MEPKKPRPSKLHKFFVPLSSGEELYSGKPFSDAILIPSGIKFRAHMLGPGESLSYAIFAPPMLQFQGWKNAELSASKRGKK